MASAPVVILACGNPSRSDDALGPLLLERLGQWLRDAGLEREFELIGDFQLQVEHALDLIDRRLALFIDAGERTPAPFVFRRAVPRPLATHSTHALSPEAVLSVLPRIGGPPPPAAFVLCVRGDSFALGEDLSVAAASHAAAAFALLTTLCREPSLDAWRARAETMGTTGNAASQTPPVAAVPLA